MKNMAERRTRMTTKVKLKNGGAIEVRIENGQIAEISYSHGVTKIAKREERAEIQFRLESIFVENLEMFKQILRNIEDDKEFFSYGCSLLEEKRNAKLKTMLEYRKECDRRLKQMQEEIDKYRL